MNKTKKLKKLIKKINKICTKRYINITNPEAILGKLSKDVFMAAIKVLEFDENLITNYSKALEVFQLIRQTNIPEEAFNKYAEKEIDYIIRFFKQFIIEMKKNENN
ncbi:hypothetical protein LCGC14_1067700 [marine sediment metagenome]|uniref:Uncharacterized protein n=1 Tax=marine sediment metagenome TaxID=412755 RepID=A0A0F9Q2B6_9ZZZZ